MAPPASRPDVLRRLLSGLARQLDLPLFGASGPGADVDRPTAKPRPKPAPRRGRSPSTVAPRTIRLGDGPLDYALRRARRKTIGFSIRAGGLTVSAPGWVGIREIEGAIREREGWVLQKLTELRRHEAAIPRMRWQDGGTLPYLGTAITLRVVAPAGGRRPAAVLDADGRTLTVMVPATDDAASADLVRDRVTTWLQQQARALFRERLAFYEARLGRAHRSLRLSSARTRWGSCSADGRILLNWRLIHFPLSAIDYVVAHELAHLKEMNHGPRFWATVASLLPDYEAARAQIRNAPPELLPTF